MSIGHACYPVDGVDAEQLLAHADRRMYKMKQSPRTPSQTTFRSDLALLGNSLDPHKLLAAKSDAAIANSRK
jgi:GGDEF domain-containing protein